MTRALTTIALCLTLTGCALIRTDMWPYPTWYWSKAAKEQRARDAEKKRIEPSTNNVTSVTTP